MDVSKRLIGQQSDIAVDKIEEKDPARLIRVPLRKKKADNAHSS